MAEASSKSIAKSEPKPLEVHQPFGSLRREIERLFDAFDRGFWAAPFGRSLFDLAPTVRQELHVAAPAVDVAETDTAFEITAELPGMDEKDIEVKVANGGLTIRGEKQEQKEEKKKDYYLQERRYGAFERSFRLPDGVDTDKIEATFAKGVLKVTLPKTPEARKAEKKIAIKAA